MCMQNKNFKITKPKPDIRELTLRNGISYPSDEELVMLLLNKGSKNMPIEKLAEKVLSVIDGGSSDNLVDRLKNIEGVGNTRALTVAAALELGRRRNSYLKSVVNNPSDIIPYIKHFAMEHTEHFVCASLNGARELMKIRVVSIGTVSRTLIHPREIFAEPVAEHASGIICCHNHPFGPCIPSSADKESTEALLKASKVLGISLLDHIIINRDGYFSFLEHGMLEDT